MSTQDRSKWRVAAFRINRKLELRRRLHLPEPIAEFVDQYRGWIYLGPLAAFYVPFLLVPAVLVFLISLFSGGSIQTLTFVGLDNYINLLTGGLLYRVLGNTIAYTAGNFVLTVGGGLFFALAIRAAYPQLRRLLQTAFLLPFAVMPVGVSLIWMFMYNQREGVINTLLASAGFNMQPHWLGDASLALPSIIIAGSWQSVGFYTLIWLVGLENIDKSLYEAAKIDGANRWQTFRYITLPQLKPIGLFLAIVSIMGSLRIFDYVWVMTQGGPARSSEVMVTWMYKIGFARNSYGEASAIGVILFVVIVVFALATSKISAAAGGASR